MNAKPTSICRDDIAWTPFPLTSLEVFRPASESVGPIADIIPFPWVATVECPWTTALDSTVSLPQTVPCEPCTVVDDNPALISASRYCEEARIQHDSRHFTYRVDSPSFHKPVFVTVMPAFYKLTNRVPPLPLRRSTAVLHGGHLVHHFGTWIMALLTIQLVSAWEYGTVAGQTLGTSGYLHSAIWLVLMLAFNLRVWFRYYGTEPEAFHVPGACLFLSATLPVLLLQLLAIL